MDTQLWRFLIFEFLRRTPQTAISGIIKTVTDMAIQRGHIRTLNDVTEDDHEKIREMVWGLLWQGVLVPGMDKSNPDLPWVRVTEYGRKCLATGEYLPHDPDGYLARLHNGVPGLDPIVEMYLAEALQTFLRGNYLASCVMLGVASEKVVLLLVEAMLNGLDSHTKKDNFQKAVSGKPIKRQFAEFKRRLDPIVPRLPTSIAESTPISVDGLFHLMRMHRNAAGHPTGRRIERDENFALLELFPVYCRTCYQLIEWLNANAI